jgi:hypothetical protein
MNCGDAFSELLRLAESEKLSNEDKAVAKQSANILGLLMKGVHVSLTTPAPGWLITGVKRLQLLSQKE